MKYSRRLYVVATLHAMVLMPSPCEAFDRRQQLVLPTKTLTMDWRHDIPPRSMYYEDPGPDCTVSPMDQPGNSCLHLSRCVWSVSFGLFWLFWQFPASQRKVECYLTSRCLSRGTKKREYARNVRCVSSNGVEIEIALGLFEGGIVDDALLTLLSCTVVGLRED